jgi:two-component system, chemotaxis family, chemotaxis protein CheY
MARVLVVDDAMIMRKNMIKMLESLDHEVVGEGKNGEEAIEKYRALKPDLVTMDITMDGMDGVTATKAIMGEDPDAKIIMCSSHGRKEVILEAMQAGAFYYITKPFKVEDLEEALSKVLED